MIQRKTFIGTLLVAGWIPLAASAQNGTSGQTPRAGQTGAQTGADATGAKHDRLALQRIDKVIGADVQDASGAKLGRIDDLVLQPDGTIGWAIVSGNTPDTMAKEYPIPWKLVRVQMAENAERNGEPTVGAERTSASDRYTLSIDDKRLASAPSFDRAQWPKGADAGIYTESNRYFGSSAVASTPDERTGRPVEAGATNPTYLRASQLRNQSVADASGMPIGTLGQVVIDPMQGRVNYVTFSTTSTAAANGRTVALPWQTIRSSRADDKDRYELTVPRERLQSAPEFQNGEENWKRMSDPSYAHDVYSYYSVRPYWNDTGADHGRKPDMNGKEGGARNPDEPKGGEKKGNEPKRGGDSGGADNGGNNNGGNSGQTGGNRPPHRG